MLSQIDRQIIKAWRRYFIEPRLAAFAGKTTRPSGPRIAVIGNCQSFGIAYALKLLDPSASVDHYSAIGKTIADIELLAKTLAHYDYVFSHDFPQGHVRGGGSRELCALLDNVVLFPGVTFAAFHPDLVYLLDPTRANKPVIGPLGHYHSALTAFAFRKGLAVEEANALFNPNVYDALGYFDLWDKAAQEFIESSKRAFDMDFSVELMNWSRRGVFMYSIVHPKPFVLYDVAKKLFARIGRKVADIDFDYFTIDDLARAEIFPVYPPIAERFGVLGSYTFKLENYHLSSTVGYFMALPEYLRGCYAAYQRLRPEQITHPRIEAWLADPATTDRLTSLARENLKAGLLPVR